MLDLAVVIVSHNDGHWLRECLLSVMEHSDDVASEVIVVDSGSSDETAELIEREFPEVRLLSCVNRGFGHANNKGLAISAARYILFLNPDTNIIAGAFRELIDAFDLRPQVGLVGVRQVTGDGELSPTMRRFPNAARALGDALGMERWRVPRRWLGEREIDMTLYDAEQTCDWTSGSFMLARREALASAGCFDERFFIYSEEPDLCLRMKQAGWETRHLPLMTIVHHAGKAGLDERRAAQDAFTRRQYAYKHFRAPHRFAYLLAVRGRHELRALLARGDRPDGATQRRVARAAIEAVSGRGDPPYAPPPRTALEAESPKLRASANA